MVINHIIEASLLNESQQGFADLNADGNINILDIIEIINLILRR